MPLVLLHAPAGYGKTTVMRQWMQRILREGGHAGWLTLQESHNDPAHLMSDLQGMLGHWSMSPAEPSELDGMATPPAWMLKLDRMAPVAPPVTLFFDEFQEVTAAPALRIVKRLIDSLPRSMRLVISSRDKPGLALERYRISGKLLELSIADLRFSLEETKDFFSGDTEQPSIWLIENLQSGTDGWPAALQLAALAARNPKDLECYVADLPGNLPHAVDYLTEAVLSGQPPEVRLFLLQTCRLPRLSAALCDAATERTDSLRILHYLKNHGLFTIALDTDATWYGYHPLFAGLLQLQQAQLLPCEQIEAIHRRAACWYASRDWVPEAIDAWLAAGDHQAAIRELERGAPDLLRQGRFSHILRWVQRLDREVLAGAGPGLTVAAAWACGLSGEREAAKQWLARIKTTANIADGTLSDADPTTLEAVLMALHGDTRAALDCGMPHYRRIGTGQSFSAGALANVMAYCLMLEGDFARARRFADDARRCNEEIGVLLGKEYAVTIASAIEAAQGNLELALERLRECAPATDTGRGPGHHEPTTASRVSVGLMSALLYEKDRIDEADELLQRHTPSVLHHPSVDLLLLTHMTRTRIKLAQGNPDAALEILEQAEHHAAADGRPRHAHDILEWEWVRIDLLTGRLAPALARADLLEHRELTGGDRRGHSCADELFGADIGAIRCAIARGEPALALMRLEREIARTRVTGQRWRQLKLMLLRALAHDAQGEQETARMELAHALHLGWSIGACRSFTEEGDRLAVMLAELPSHILTALPAPDAIVGHWRTLCGMLPGYATLSASINPPLTDREHAILKLLATGMGNEQVAACVFLSVNTVKWHIRRILEKLHARNRNEAVYRARQRGLVN